LNISLLPVAAVAAFMAAVVPAASEQEQDFQ
jgi:hypothetical protein